MSKDTAAFILSMIAFITLGLQVVMSIDTHFIMRNPWVIGAWLLYIFIATSVSLAIGDAVAGKRK